MAVSRGSGEEGHPQRGGVERGGRGYGKAGATATGHNRPRRGRGGQWWDGVIVVARGGIFGRAAKSGHGRPCLAAPRPDKAACGRM